jgi:hypothetical protein
MAAIIRSAKAESDWTANDLQAYYVIVVDENVVTFFGDTQLPPPPVRQAILTSVDYPENGLPDKEDRLFFSYMRYAMLRAKPGEESLVGDFVGDFTRHLLSMLHYDDYGRVIRWNASMPLFMCGSNVDTQADIYVAEQNGHTIVLLVLEDRTHQKMGDPEAQLFAKAVAAFQSQNKRLRNAGLPPTNAKVFPGIIMDGTAPTFYKIDITAAVVEAIETGQHPAQVAIMHKLVPPIPRPGLLRDEGMRPLDNRAIFLSCFEAFKQFV